MIIFTILGILTAIFFFVVILMSIIETRIKNRKTEKLLWKMDKVETRTGGLAHDRNRTYSEIQKGNEKQ
jgi:predicted membrane protein